jgi:hypothetical protein
MSRLRPLLLSALLLSGQAAVAGPNLVVNGDFETADFTGWTRGAFGTQWVGPDWSGTALSNPLNNVFSEGADYQLGYLGQTIATVAGAHYTLEFDLQRPDGSGGNLDNETLVSFGAQQLLHQSNVSGDWSHIVLSNLVAGGNSTLLRFGNRSVYDYDQLDNVTLVMTAVPEPAPALMLFGGLALLWRCRRRAA